MVGLSFMMHAVCDGISFSIGIIFHSMQEVRNFGNFYIEDRETYFFSRKYLTAGVPEVLWLIVFSSVPKISVEMI